MYHSKYGLGKHFLMKQKFGMNFISENDKQKLEKTKIEGEGVATTVVEKLNKTMFVKLQEIEGKREKATALERKLSKMADGPKKRQITYQKQQEEAMAIKYKRTPVDEERALHEAYQVWGLANSTRQSYFL